MSSVNDNISDNSEEILWWNVDIIEIFEDNTIKYYKNGEEIAYPWIKLS